MQFLFIVFRHGKSKNFALKSSVGFSQFSSNTLCSFVFDHLYSAVLFGFPESVWLEKVHCNKVYCGFVSQKVSGWIKFFPLLCSQGISLPPHPPHPTPHPSSSVHCSAQQHLSFGQCLIATKCVILTALLQLLVVSLNIVSVYTELVLVSWSSLPII